MDINSKIDLKNNRIFFTADTEVYSKEVIFKTCYAFIDRMYIYLDKTGKNSIEVSLRGKKILKSQALEKMKGEFFNELLNTLVREDIVKKNKKIVEYIVGGAIKAALEKEEISERQEAQMISEEVNIDIDLDIEKEIVALRKKLSETEDEYDEDPLGIKKIANSDNKRGKKKKI
jgi:His-Xaa-Ser system protein HxsD